MAGLCVVVGGLEVGEMADELLEFESVIVSVVEHAVHDEVANGVHVDLLKWNEKFSENARKFRVHGQLATSALKTITNGISQKFASMSLDRLDFDV